MRERERARKEKERKNKEKCAKDRKRKTGILMVIIYLNIERQYYDMLDMLQILDNTILFCFFPPKVDLPVQLLFLQSSSPLLLAQNKFCFFAAINLDRVTSSKELCVFAALWCNCRKSVTCNFFFLSLKCLI